MSDFRKARIRRTSHALALAVYRAASAFPPHERFALAEPVRRAAVSLPANIAEGGGRRFRRDEAHLRQITFGSAREPETGLLLARDLGYLASEAPERRCGLLLEVKRMLSRLAQRTYAQSPRLAPDRAAPP